MTIPPCDLCRNKEAAWEGRSYGRRKPRSQFRPIVATRWRCETCTRSAPRPRNGTHFHWIGIPRINQIAGVI